MVPEYAQLTSKYSAGYIFKSHWACMGHVADLTKFPSSTPNKYNSVMNKSRMCLGIYGYPITPASCKLYTVSPSFIKKSYHVAVSNFLHFSLQVGFYSVDLKLHHFLTNQNTSCLFFMRLPQCIKVLEMLEAIIFSLIPN